MIDISREKLRRLQLREERRFVTEHPKSAELYARAKDSLLGGVPMNWMKKWAKRFNDGVAAEIKKNGLPWNVIQLGARAEYHFRERPPRNGGESAASADFELERFLHLFALNRGVLLTPFHNMALMCLATTASDVDLHTGIFAEAASELTM